MKQHLRALPLLAVAMLVLAACGGGDAATTTAATTETTAAEVTTTAGETTTTEADTSTTAGGAMTPVKACMVTDDAGVDDRSFNASAWQGIQDAEASGAAVDIILLESDDESDYEPNLAQCLSQGAEHIVTTGFKLGAATQAAAEANPDVTFTIVDFGYDPDIPNIRELVYQTDEAAFAAGYLAAGVSQTGVIGTYGGVNIPTVSIFLDGLARGVQHYNEVKGTDVQVIGWDIEAQDGSFTGTFDPADPAVRALCESILDEGADIMLPVGGAINLPCGTAIQDRGLEAALIGVDADAFEAMPAEYQDLWLVTIEKGIAIQVQRSIEAHASGEWTPGGTVGNLENDAVGLSDFHSWSDRVPAELAAEVEQILADIKAGTIDASFFTVG